MNLYGLMPTNKYTWIGFALMMLGFFTLPILVGFIFMPVGIGLFVFGVHKAWYDIGKSIYSIIEKFRKK